MTIGTNSAQCGLAQAVANSIKISPDNGYHFIDKDGNKTEDTTEYAGIQFDNADDQTDKVNTNQYTIEYTTEHDLKNGKYTVANEAQFVKPDGINGPNTGAIKADIAGLNAGRNNYKEYDAATGITENADGTISIPWKVRVDVSKVKTISKGTVLKDTILDSGHVMTGKQAKDWGGAFTWTDSSEKPVGTENGSFTDSEYYELGFYTDNTYNQTKPLSDLQDTDEIYGYKITLLKDVTAPGNADKMLIKYSTTGKIDATKENSYRNRFFMDDQYWTPAYKYTLATITKTDGSGKIGTTTVDNETGEVTWKIVVRTDTLKLHEKITVVDELPTGIEAESVQILFGTSGSLLLDVPTDGGEKSTYKNRDTFRVRRDGQKLTMSLENPDGKIMQGNDTTFIIKGKIVSTNGGKPIEEGVKNIYSNTASVSFDGGASIPSNTQTQEWTKKKDETPEKEVLTKGHSWDAKNQLMTYTVDINPDAKEFFAEEKDANGNPIKYDYLTLEDTFTLAKHPDSVGGTPKDKTAEDIDRTKVDIEALLMETKLYYAKTDADGKPVFDEDGKLVPGTEVKGWTLKTRVDSSTDWCNKYLMTIENVPNKTPLVLEYAYQISSNLLEVYPKTKYEYNDDSYININNVSNNIELSGTGIVKSTGGITTSWSSSSSGATLSSGNSVTIVKIEEGAENTKLAGAKFQLQMYNATTQKYEKAETLHSHESDYTTDEYGRLKVAQSVTVTEDGKEIVHDELKKDFLYRLIEMEAPAGYEPPTETERIANAVYFYSSSGDGATIDGPKEDVAKATDLAKGSKTVTITNKPNKTELTVRKVWEDENGNATVPGANNVTLQLYRAEYDQPPYTSAIGRVAANITQKGNGSFTNKDALTQQIANELTNLPEGSTFDVVVTVITGGVLPENERTDRDAIYWNNTKCLTKPDGPEPCNGGNSSKTTYTYHLTMKKGVNILRGVIDTSNAEGSRAWNTNFTVEIKNINKAAAANKLKEDAFSWTGTGEDGKFTLTAEGNWMKTFETLPLTGKNDREETIYYGYSVKEVKVGDTEVVDNRAEEWIVSNGGDGYTSGTITVTNHKPSSPPDTPDSPGYELPATGSTGTAPYTTAGAVLMAAALVGGYRRKRRQERRGE